MDAEAEAEEGGVHTSHGGRGRHIKKRALKNKALSISFDEKDLRNYVTGFHKRKKKRRKEAQKQQAEAERRLRIEQRKERKLERELAYGGAPPTTDSASDGSDEFPEEDGASEPIASVSGTTTYDNADMKVTVTTSEISHEEETFSNEKTQASMAQPIGATRKHKVPVTKKKPFKRVAKQKSRPKPQKKREKRKGKKKTKSRH